MHEWWLLIIHAIKHYLCLLSPVSARKRKRESEHDREGENEGQKAVDDKNRCCAHIHVLFTCVSGHRRTLAILTHVSNKVRSDMCLSPVAIRCGQICSATSTAPHRMYSRRSAGPFPLSSPMASCLVFCGELSQPLSECIIFLLKRFAKMWKIKPVFPFYYIITLNIGNQWIPPGQLGN